MKFFKIAKYQLYLLQLENYELKRYLKLVWSKGLFPKLGQRKDLVWTLKAQVVFAVAIVLYAIIIFILALHISIILPIPWGLDLLIILIFYILFFPLLFLFYGLATLLLYPVDFAAKQFFVSKAKTKLESLGSSLKIIGIAGSYGKTTMKEVLRAVLSKQFSVLSTPESVNTPLGISRFILDSVSNETQVLILEMGEHYKGDIKEICELAKPDIAVITGINEAHMERMGNEKVIVETIFEVTQNAKVNAEVYINAEDKNILDNYEKFIFNHQTLKKYSSTNIHSPIFKTDSLSWEGEHAAIGKFSVRLLGEYVLGNIDAAVQMATALGLAPGQIVKGIQTILPVSHRLAPTLTDGNILVIDDAYNGNSAGAKEAIKVLGKFADRRKIYITPGLVETGTASQEVHVEIGKELAAVADVVILIKDSVTKYIEEGIHSVIARSASDEAIQSEPRLPRPSDAFRARNDKPQVIYFNSAPEAHEALKTVLQPNDVILFQNDWGDQYL